MLCSQSSKNGFMVGGDVRTITMELRFQNVLEFRVLSLAFDVKEASDCMTVKARSAVHDIQKGFSLYRTLLAP